MGETIALIGCGAGNAALVAHLAASGWEEIDELYLIDPRIPARGTAFDHDEEYLLCNTSVAVNSVFPDDSSHFLRWLHTDTSHPGCRFHPLARSRRRRARFGGTSGSGLARISWTGN